MEDIELVIKIPKEDYKAIKNKQAIGDLTIPYVFDAIRNGTTLPEGHGALKDTDVMVNKLCTHEASELFGSVICAEILDFINDEKPIIEAERSEEE